MEIKPKIMCLAVELQEPKIWVQKRGNYYLFPILTTVYFSIVSSSAVIKPLFNLNPVGVASFRLGECEVLEAKNDV